MQVTVKVVSVFEGNLKLGLPNHLALITLFDPATGAPKSYDGDTQAKAACAAVAYAIARGDLRAVQDFSRMDITGITVA